jgi:glutaryl-CoA dehydrogenase
MTGTALIDSGTTDVTRTAPARAALELEIDALLTPEELRWRDRVRTFTRERITPVVDADFEDRHFRRELVAELGGLGVLGMHLEGYGCAGAGAVSYGLTCLELEAGDTAWRTFVSVQGSLAMSAIAKWGSQEHKQRWLPEMAAGRAIGCFGLTEPDGGSDPAGMKTVARKDGSDWVLNGAKRWIGLGSVADVAVVWAATDEGVRGFLVPAGTPGFTATEITNKLSLRASIQCDLTFEECRLPADAVLPGVVGLRGPFSCLNEARYGIIWGVMGAARECLRAAVERSQTRRVFGKALAEFQLTQQKVADMAVEYQKGLLLSLHIGRLKDAGQAEQRARGDRDRPDHPHHPRRRRGHLRLPGDAPHGEPGVGPHLRGHRRGALPRDRQRANRLPGLQLIVPPHAGGE